MLWDLQLAYERTVRVFPHISPITMLTAANELPMTVNTLVDSSWLRDVHILTDTSNCPIHLLPEVDVSDSSMFWCEGVQLPHKTIYRHQYAV